MNIISLLETCPDAETVQTVNAAENEHMIAVNTELGLRTVERSTAWKLKI